MKTVKGQARRRPKARALVRGEPVVRGVLEATLEELARIGYQGLRIEDVAARAGVNKTTVYRRWPTKADLVQAALRTITDAQVAPESTGSLREDLLMMARHAAVLSGSREGQSLLRMIIGEGLDPELMGIVAPLRKSLEAQPRALLKAAEARGEIAPGIDAELLFDLLLAAIHHRLFLHGEPIDEGFLGRLVDLLLLGALPPSKRGGSAAL